MDSDGPEVREQWVDLADLGLPARAGFRIDTSAQPDAGTHPGPTLVLDLRWLGERDVFVAVTTDRMAGRLADCDVRATLDHQDLADPAAGLAFMGGPATARRLAPGERLTQPVPLVAHVAPSTRAGWLRLRLTRRLLIGVTPEAALAATPVQVEAVLALAWPP